MSTKRSEVVESLKSIVGVQVKELGRLAFSPPVTHVYNPLVYAKACHFEYLDKYGRSAPEAVLVGMNPGPWGMVQTGVPFGVVSLVRDWLEICGPVGQPLELHPKRPVLGFDCKRKEVSGWRLWGWAREVFGTPDRFFDRFFVVNYCPLAFFQKDGGNVTPDKLRASDR
ncbi:MAG: single-stranded DNA-binding protein, partial [Planctomycetota bacterium]